MRRIDSLTKFKIWGKKDKLRWCQDEVTGIVERSSKPKVTVKWDALTDVDGKEGMAIEGEQELLPSKWNKDVEKAWRLDVNIAVSWFDEDDDDVEEEGGIAISEILDDDEQGSEDSSSNMGLSDNVSSTDYGTDSSDD